MKETELYALLEKNGITYQHFSHPAVYTVEQANQHLQGAPGARTKNLFISDEKKRNYYILWTLGEKRVDFKPFGKTMRLGKARFGSPERMLEYLGVEPGAVSVLTLVNDTNRKVGLLIDKELWENSHFQCHPIVNTATIVISKQDIEKFFKLTGHTFQLVDVPGKK
jgi:Ala-tRNA(Pro) deacylase